MIARRKATCKLCPHPGRILSFNGSTTSNLWSHIKSQHDRVFAASSSKRDGEAKKSSIGSTSSLQRQASGASSSQILSFVQKSVSGRPCAPNYPSHSELVCP